MNEVTKLFTLKVVLNSLYFNETSSISFSTRKNKEIDLTEYYNLVYQYKNDCLTAAVQYKKDFYVDNDIKPTEQLFFSITIVPLGTYETRNILQTETENILQTLSLPGS